ncbi:sensor histidine kinase [Rhodovulum adriaticum]|uniref:histidine kinase n=1 Tax=Rhodovulum adriaticum TaxID=35804 RepID=A0A4R2NLJ2_RHOAD|nr:ATP-binding protein [Rhodovulum adriaticum]MBK1636474.1 PAS domain-containing sensor histidine kinase [Rhodovulum adriaticum]TCP22218.1 two-component system sensor histidine kinase HupT/HoxJ [Rhodovulum adriaticum]
MADEITTGLVAETAEFSDAAWSDVLSAVDRTYTELVGYQERLERQNAELEKMRSFLASILASVSDVLVVVSRHGDIEKVSQSVAAMTGRDRATLAGQTVVGLFAQADRAALIEGMQRAAVNRAPETIEIALNAKDGTSPLELSISPRLDERGRVSGHVLTGRPLGELRQAYADLAHSHDELKAAQTLLVRNEKLASLGRLLAGVAHELNNPISFVYANVHALERYAAKLENYFDKVQAGAPRADLVKLREELRLDREIGNMREAVAGARDGAERVRDIVEDLRRLSSEGTGEVIAFDLVETASVAASWVLRGTKRDVQVTFSGESNLIVEGRPGHIQQVVMNLVQNALDALETEEQGHIELSAARAGGFAVLSVADNGPGVPEPLRQSIFDPFFTTKAVGKGTGLGLSISHKIAQEHGGDLRLCPEQDGTCFQIALPLPKDPA